MSTHFTQENWREHAEWCLHEGVTVVECPGCGFCFGAEFVDDSGDTKGRYSCPLCATEESELAAALREIGRG